MPKQDRAEGLHIQLQALMLQSSLAQAELTERDFAAERGAAVVISTGAVDAKEEARSVQDRAAAEARNSYRCAAMGLRALQRCQRKSRKEKGEARLGT